MAAPPLLKGLLFDAAGEPMTPTHTRKGSSKLYRYYVSFSVQKGAKDDAERFPRRTPVPLIDALVTACVRRMADRSDPPVRPALVRVEAHPGSLHLLLPRPNLLARRLDPQSEQEHLTARLKAAERLAFQETDRVRMIVPCQLDRRHGRTIQLDSDGRVTMPGAGPDLALIRGLKAAHRLVAGLRPEDDAPLAARPELVIPSSAPSSFYEKRLCRLAFLAPDLQQAIRRVCSPAG